MSYFGKPRTTRAILERFPALKRTCDISDWVCEAERMLEDGGEIIQRAAQQCHRVHARVGYEGKPQGTDLRAPEWAHHLAAREKSWDLIWALEKQRGMVTASLTPEFGLAPSLPTLTFPQAPVADLAEICDWMARRQAGRFASTDSGEESPALKSK